MYLQANEQKILNKRLYLYYLYLSLYYFIIFILTPTYVNLHDTNLY